MMTLQAANGFAQFFVWACLAILIAGAITKKVQVMVFAGVSTQLWLVLYIITAIRVGSP